MSEVNKIANYNQMMSWLTRPATPKTQVASAETDALKEKFNEKLGPGVIKTLDELPPIQDPFKNFEDRNPRETAAQGGAIGGGTIKGEDLGSRTGFTRPIISISELSKDQQTYINDWLKNNPNKKWEDLTYKQRDDLKKFTDVGSGTGSKIKSGVDNPFYEPLSKKGEKIAKHVYGTTDISDYQRQGINQGNITMDTKPVLFDKEKQISLKMKRGSETVTGVNFPDKTINLEGKVESAKELEKRFIKFVKDRVKFPVQGLQGSGFSNFNISEEFPISEKQAGRLSRYYINKLGLKYSTNIQNPSASQTYYKTKEKYEKASSPKEEGRITTQKTKILAEKNLFKKIDKAHRVSKTHMVKLGLQFDTNLIGMDSRIINQVIVKPAESTMNGLYARQRKTLELLKKNPNSEDLKNKMFDLNKQIKQIVKDTSGRLIGVTIDPNTLEPSFEGIKKKNTFSKFLGDNYKIADLDKVSNEDLSKAIAKAVDAEAKRGFVPNDFKNILSNKESKKAILQYAKKVAPDAIAGLKKAFLNPTSKVSMKLLNTFPVLTGAGLVAYGVGKEISEGRDPISMSAEASEINKELPQGSPGQLNPEDKSLLEEYPLTTGAAAAATPLATKTGRKVYGSLAKTLLKGFGSVPVSAYLSGKELTSEDPNYAVAGADLLLPELGKRVAGSGTGIMAKAGRFLTNPIGKLARGFTPVGIGLQGVELVNQAMKEQKRIDNMRENDPEAYQQFIAEQEDMLRESAAYGGRMGFADGPEDPDKRKFMKIMGGLASLPILGRFFDVATQAPKVAEVVKRSAEGIPDFITDLIAKVKLKAETTGMKYFTGNSSDEFADVYKADDYTVTEQGNKITISKRKESGEMIEKDMEIELEMDPETRSINYKEASARPDAEGKLKDVDEYIDDIDLEDMRKYTYDE